MIQLKKVDSKNLWEIVKLSVDESQKEFVATNTGSILEAYVTVTSGCVALPFGIYCDNTPVGFAMIGYSTIGDEDEPDIAKDNYIVWRFMIDSRYQGRGYGRESFRAVLDYIKTMPCGKAEYCWLSYEPQNFAAKKLYASFGFKETGEMDGDEAIAVLKL